MITDPHQGDTSQTYWPCIKRWSVFRGRIDMASPCLSAFSYSATCSTYRSCPAASWWWPCSQTSMHWRVVVAIAESNHWPYLKHWWSSNMYNRKPARRCDRAECASKSLFSREFWTCCMTIPDTAAALSKDQSRHIPASGDSRLHRCTHSRITSFHLSQMDSQTSLWCVPSYARRPSSIIKSTTPNV